MNPSDPVGVRYELAALLYEQGTSDSVAEAKALMIRALALAPRFRAGHRLLLQIVEWQEGQERQDLQTNGLLQEQTESLQ